MTSYTVLPGAQWRPLGDPAQTSPITPRLLIFHTMVGYLTSTENMWRPTGYRGNFSTFGVGGPWDGTSLDGAVYQWQSMYRIHAANWDSNPFSNSIETSDGGDPSRPWSPKQVTTLIGMTVDWCRETGQPCQMATAWDGSGIGYHRQFPQWNHNAHQCPGPVRENQLRTVIVPQAAAILAERPTLTPTPAPKGLLMALSDAEQAELLAKVRQLHGAVNVGDRTAWLYTHMLRALRFGDSGEGTPKDGQANLSDIQHPTG
jgi:hypothetical protein